MYSPTPGRPTVGRFGNLCAANWGKKKTDLGFCADLDQLVIWVTSKLFRNDVNTTWLQILSDLAGLGFVIVKSLYWCFDRVDTGVIPLSNVPVEVHFSEVH